MNKIPSLITVFVISIQTWPGGASQLHSETFWNQPKARKGGLSRPQERLGARWAWPTGRALFTADPTHVEEARAVCFMGVFHRLYHGRKCLCQLSAFLQRFLFS